MCIGPDQAGKAEHRAVFEPHSTDGAVNHHRHRVDVVVDDLINDQAVFIVVESPLDQAVATGRDPAAIHPEGAESLQSGEIQHGFADRFAISGIKHLVGGPEP